MAHEVFISYATEDKTVADAVCAALEGQGIRCWYAPRDVVGKWRQAIVDAIEDSRVMVVVLSLYANSSREVLNEINIGLQQELPVIPIRVARNVPTGAMRLALASVHWLDALEPPLQAYLDRLLSKVQSCLGRRGRSHGTGGPSITGEEGTL